MIQEVRILDKGGADPRGHALLHDIQRMLKLPRIEDVRAVKVYRLEGIDAEAARHFARQALCDPVSQTFRINSHNRLGAQTRVEVGYQPGVMNPEVASVLKAAANLGISMTAADVSHDYHFMGSPTSADVDTVCERLLVNKTVERVVQRRPKTLVLGSERGSVAIIPIRNKTDAELEALAEERQLHLNLEEMQVVRAYYQEVKKRDPTDIELETIAGAWSEHCCHKTFNARLKVNGKWKKPLMRRIVETSRRYDGLVATAFIDNSGGIYFYDGYVVLGKVETHNGPSAIEPFGGAQTGVGGVLRDILGTGEGAIVLLSTDIFCFAPLDLPLDQLPPGCLHPDYLFRKVVAGVGSYGNCVGVPTSNGSVHFHPDFRAKPTVIVGAYGLIPEDQCQKGEPRPGDKIIVIGGKTGRDGIHGATFASGKMTARTIVVNGTSVQLGQAIEEKRVMDATVECRKRRKVVAITDCGACGLESAITEMGEHVGVRVYIDRVPTKYPGLSDYELWISESQERMVMAAAPEDVADILAICAHYNVEATVLGEFTGDKQLTILDGDEVVCDLSMEFVHNGLPQREMVANWKRPTFSEPVIPALRGVDRWVDQLTKVLRHPNVCSKEPIVRTYDHGVQGTNALAPFSGVRHDGPNDATVLKPLAGKPYGLVVSHGLNPILNLIDPYWGSIWAAVESLANLVAVGGNPREVGLIDNFIWPFPDEDSLGALDLSVEGLIAVLEAFRLALLSGKDSLASTYVWPDGTEMKIPPVLCVSAFGRIRDVMKTISADLKGPGNALVLLGQLNANQLAGSAYYDVHGHTGNRLPKVDLSVTPRLMQQLHKRINDGRILSCHDVSEGGMLTALAEMCFGGQIGATIDVRQLGEGRLDGLAFSEMAGCFLLEVPRDSLRRNPFPRLPWSVIGETTATPVLRATSGSRHLFTAPLDELKQAWQQPMQEVMQ